MRRWVVTGPAGGGKSRFCRFLERGGAAVLDGDRLGHEILDRPDVQAALRSKFGDPVLRGGVVDRSVLGGIVFDDPGALRELNGITHPPLAALMTSRLNDIEKSGGHDLAVLEAAVYFLLPPVPGVDLVITVTASDSTRLARLTEGSGLSPEKARIRIEAQRQMEAGWAAADLVVANEGTLAELEAEAAAVLARLED